MAAMMCLNLEKASAQLVHFTVTDQPSALAVQTPSYAVHIGKTDYSLTVLRGQVDIVRSGPRGAGFLVVGGQRHRLTRVRNWTEEPEGLTLVVGTDAGAAAVEVRLVFYRDHLNVTWTVPEQLAVAQVEEAFLLKPGGHWYGGNVTSGHHWPLETGEIELDPFRATSNQTAPIWLTSSGAGWFVPTYAPMGFSINRERDGLFRFNVKETQTLSYHVLVGDVGIGEDDEVYLVLDDQLLEVVFGEDWDAVGILRSGELRRVLPARDVGDLSSGESDHLVRGVVAVQDVEVVKVPPGGTENNDARRHVPPVG